MSLEVNTVKPTDFQSPEQISAPKPTLLRPAYFIIAALLVVLLSALYFMLSARALLIRTNVDTAQIEVTDGLSFMLGDSYLLLKGKYKLNIEAEGYQPISETLHISSDTATELRYNLLPLPGDLQITLVNSESGETISELHHPVITLTRPELASSAPVFSGDALFISDLDAGLYELNITSALYAEKTLTVEVPGKASIHDVEVPIVPNWGWVSFEANPSTVSITQKYGRSTPFSAIHLDSEIPTDRSQKRFRMKIGEPQLRIEAEGYKPIERFFSVAKAAEINLGEIVLQPVDSQIQLSTTPATVSVIVGGNYAGETPLTLDLAPDREHKIELVKPGYTAITQRIRVERNSQQQLDFRLQPDVINVSVSISPANAEIQINGSPVSVANNHLSLPAIEHQIQVSAPGYETKTLPFQPIRGTGQHLQISLLTNEQALWANIPNAYQSIAGQQLLLFRDAGNVQLGSSRRETGRRANETQWAAELRRPFYTSTTEVTNRQYKLFNPDHSSGNFKGNSLDSPNQPVVNLSWQQAALYCNWLSERENLPPFYTTSRGFVSGTNPESTGYRLITEAEWTWLAAFTTSGLRQKYPWGDDESLPSKVENYADESIAADINFTLEGVNDSFKVSAPVGSFDVNEKGLYDIAGNVTEWVNDWYKAAPYESDEAVVDPIGPEVGEFHVIRGASWARGYLPQIRLGYRDYDSTGRNDLGFRIARYAK